jgi:hypothetical protein
MVKYVKANTDNLTHIKIYQIDSDRDMQLYYDTKDSDSPKGRIMFEPYNRAQKYGWDESLYNLVWEDDVTTDNLEEIYTMFGNNYEGTRPFDFKGHTLSMSDVVVKDGQAYYCDRFGWTKIPFDESKTF